MRSTAITAAILVQIAIATPVLAADISLDHEGNNRCFDIDQAGQGSAPIFSRGNGGCLAATLRGHGETEIFMLGDGVRGRVVDHGGSGSTFLGMCPPGMTLEPVYRAPGSTGLRLPRCIRS